MSAIREALSQRDLLRCRFDEWWEAVGEDGDLAKMAKHRDDCPNCVLREAALAEVEALERVVEAAREMFNPSLLSHGAKLINLRAALAELDGQT